MLSTVFVKLGMVIPAGEKMEAMGVRGQWAPPTVLRARQWKIGAYKDNRISKQRWADSKNRVYEQPRALDADTLLKMEEVLNKRVVGQEEAVKAAVGALRCKKFGFQNNPTLLFAGPTGVGKSELAKALATASNRSLFTLHMSHLIKSPQEEDFCEKFEELLESVSKSREAIVVLEDIEYAPDHFYPIMTQMLDEGVCRFGCCNVDFSKTLVIMTTTAGIRDFEILGRHPVADLGYDDDENIREVQSNRMKKTVTNFLERSGHRFFNRFHQVVVFNLLNKKDLKKIAEIMLNEVFQRVKKNNGINLRVMKSFLEKLVEEGYNPLHGARCLRRTIGRLLEQSMAREILSGQIKNGDTVFVDVDGNGNVIFEKEITGHLPKPSLKQD